MLWKIFGTIFGHERMQEIDQSSRKLNTIHTPLYPRGVMFKAMDRRIVVKSSYSSRSITFTFCQMPLGKAWNPFILPTMG